MLCDDIEVLRTLLLHSSAESLDTFQFWLKLGNSNTPYMGIAVVL